MSGNLIWALIFVVILLLGGITTYMYFFIKGIFMSFNKEINYPEKIVTGVASFCLALACINIFSTFTIVMLHIVFTGILVDLVYILFHKILKNVRDTKGYKIWSSIYGYRILPVFITIILIAYGYANMMNVVCTEYDVDSHMEFTIEEDGNYRVALIADLHYGVSMDNAMLQSVCEDISEKDVDIVVLCGDITDESTTKQGMQDAFRILGSIKSKYGIFYVYGNHDIQTHSDSKTFTETEHRQMLESVGIIIMRDSVYKVNDEFAIIGRLDSSFYRKNKETRKPMKELMESVMDSQYVLTLDHQPNDYEENREAGTNLLLSGHTHAGQIWPANYILELMSFNDAVYGMEVDEKEFKAIVTSGIAGWGYTIKTSSPAEYVIIDIQGQNMK